MHCTDIKYILFFISIKFIHSKFKVLIFSAIHYVSVAVYKLHNICNKIKLIRQFVYPTFKELNIYVFTETMKTRLFLRRTNEENFKRKIYFSIKLTRILKSSDIKKKKTTKAFSLFLSYIRSKSNKLSNI